MRHLLLVLTGFIITATAHAQEKWSLPKCIEYAMANNITIKQTALQSDIAAITLKQSKLDQIPNLNFNGGPSYSSGRNQDPTTFSLITQSYVSANMQLQSSGEIFNFFSKRNTIAANEWELLATRANTDKLRNDIALTVANLYLQILLGIEQEKIAGIQLQQSQAQLVNTRKLVDAGALPELNAAELEAQVARDSATVISAKGAVIQNKLSLKAYMGMDAATPFEVETPPVDRIPVEKIADLQPEYVYMVAMTNMPQQRFNDYKIKAAQKSSAAARGSLYPTLSAFGSLGTAYNSRAQEIISVTQVNAPFGNVTVNGTDYQVFPITPFNDYNYGKTSFGDQANQNFRQSIGLNLSIPIFNGYAAKANYLRSKINVRNQQLQKEADDQKLKQDIFQAYNAAIIALEKYNAGKKAVETAERSYYFAQKRFEVGMMSTFELITNQNNLFSARLQHVLNQYDYVFKMKVLEFYKGMGLKL
jgi:outer membrane protein